MDKQENKVVLSLHVADELIRRGFNVIRVKPSTTRKGFAAFIFENTPEFNMAFDAVANKGIRRYHNYK